MKEFIHPELRQGEVLLINVKPEEDWSKHPSWIESVRIGDVAYTTNGERIVHDMKPLFGKLKAKKAKKWIKSDEHGTLPTFYLSKEADEGWFAKVFCNGGKYHFTIGERLDSETTSKPRWQSYGLNPKGWTSAQVAKTKALEWILKKKLGI